MCPSEVSVKLSVTERFVFLNYSWPTLNSGVPEAEERQRRHQASKEVQWCSSWWTLDNETDSLLKILLFHLLLFRKGMHILHSMNFNLKRIVCRYIVLLKGRLNFEKSSRVWYIFLKGIFQNLFGPLRALWDTLWNYLSIFLNQSINKLIN